MSANQFGNILKAMSFGESHGRAMGVVIDGVPAGLNFENEELIRDINRRRPGQSAVVTDRNELDRVEILSGVFEGRTLGTPIAAIVENKDQRSLDYAAFDSQVRKGHADQMWLNKFGHHDLRGGGRSSGRETVSRVIVGSVAKMIFSQLSPSTKWVSYAQQIGPFSLTDAEQDQIFIDMNQSQIERSPTRFPGERSQQVTDFLLQAKSRGESYGGVVECIVKNMPLGLGQPVFHKLKADLAAALLSIGATIGLEFGLGFQATQQEGGDWYSNLNKKDLGGIQGGISSGEALVVRVAFKPTSSVLEVAKKGRHDPCIVPRAVVVVESMVMWVLTDHLLWSRLDRL